MSEGKKDDQEKPDYRSLMTYEDMVRLGMGPGGFGAGHYGMCNYRGLFTPDRDRGFRRVLQAAGRHILKSLRAMPPQAGVGEDPDWKQDHRYGALAEIGMAMHELEHPIAPPAPTPAPTPRPVAEIKDAAAELRALKDKIRAKQRELQSLDDRVRYVDLVPGDMVQEGDECYSPKAMAWVRDRSCSLVVEKGEAWRRPRTNAAEIQDGSRKVRALWTEIAEAQKQAKAEKELYERQLKLVQERTATIQQMDKDIAERKRELIELRKEQRYASCNAPDSIRAGDQVSYDGGVNWHVLTFGIGSYMDRSYRYRRPTS